MVLLNFKQRVQYYASEIWLAIMHINKFSITLYANLIFSYVIWILF